MIQDVELGWNVYVCVSGMFYGMVVQKVLITKVKDRNRLFERYT